MKVFCLAVAALLIPAFAEPKFVYWPGSSYDGSIPTEKQVLGYEPGDRISSHENILKYLEALAKAAPTRMKVFEYAKTWEHRPLVYAAIGSPATIARLDKIKADMQRLADPRKTSDAEAKQIISSTPAVIWLAYGVHGNEISSPDAALMTAYHLLASRNDKMVDEILAKDLILIDPQQNPDGRDRFVHNFEIAEGLQPDPSQLAAEHNEPWPGGRTNHYYFDMNRDWFAITQPETRGRIKTLLEWYPLVFVDLHEMGSDATYYFTPEADPYNPYILKSQRESLEWFGRNNAKWFDEFGFNYFTREGYDEFYPGYGASWPLYYGSIAMTYEQASTRGLIVRQTNGTVVPYRQTVREHFVASVSSAETAAHNHDKLLENFYHYRQTAVAEGTKGPVREYILPRTGDTTTVDKLAVNLATQGIEVKRATAPFKNAGNDYPQGSYAIPLAQPMYRMIRTFLDPQVSMDAEFLKGEEHRRKERLPSEMYDVTAWSLPLQYNIGAVGSADVSKGSFEPVVGGRMPEGKVVGNSPTVAYLVPAGTSGTMAFLARALQEHLHVLSTDKEFKLAGRTYGRGTLIVRVKDNGADLADTVQRLARKSDVDVYTTDTGWVDEGANFGSHNVFTVPPAKIAIAWDQPTNSSAAGATRFLLEREYDTPVTVARTSQFANSDLSAFNVIVLPDAGGFGGGGGYAGALGQNGARRLKDWVEAGGTLIGVGPGAVTFLADSRSQLLAISQENLAKPAGETPGAGRNQAAPAAAGGGNAAAPPTDGHVPGKLLASDQDFEKAIQPDTDQPDSLHGVLLRAKVYGDHWLTDGVADTVNVLVQGRAIFAPIKMDKGINAVYYAGPDQILASGFMWEQNRKQLAYKPFLVVQRDGRGFVIGFTADPNFRGYMDGLNTLFLNAVFRGPAHATGGGGRGGEQ
ncbi:MAG TPA: M14 metallopeptidase family protein [Bryobacteraceae bacterium]|nr:M14 metallopeptidase family protein [Bryobacteraceae bacterium]